MKNLFTPFLLAVAISLNAQNPGYTKTFIYDNFATVKEYADPKPKDPNYPDGIYWWGKSATGSDTTGKTAPCYIANKYALSRLGNGKLNLSVSQGSECWEPFGISTKLDLSKNANFEISITNNSATAIYFDVLIVDSNKKIINSQVSGINFSVPSIAPNETKIFSGNFKGGVHKSWPGPVYTSGFDLSKVIEIDFTIVNADQPENNNWGPLPISDLSVSLNYVKIGGIGSNSVNELNGNQLLNIFPNPTENGIVHVTQNISNVIVYNHIGEIVFKAASTNLIDLSNMNAGVYSITSNEGFNKVIVK